jgi:hypothetical protein
LLVQNRSTQEKTTPRFRAFRASGNRSCVASTPASMPSPARKVRESESGFSTGHPALAKRNRHPCRLPLRGLSTPTRRCRGAPGRAAGHRGPHFSEEPSQEQSRSAPRTLRTGVSSSFEDDGVAGIGFVLGTVTRKFTLTRVLQGLDRFLELRLKANLFLFFPFWPVATLLCQQFLPML